MLGNSTTRSLVAACTGLLIVGCTDLRSPSEAGRDDPRTTAVPISVQKMAAPNVVTDWAGIVQHAIHNPDAPRPPASSEVLHAMVMLAMYDAAIAVEGGYEPFAAAIDAPPGTDVRAAVATAAYRTALERVALSQHAYLSDQYGAYLAGMADGPAKANGIQVGEDAAAAMLALRADDGFDSVVLYECNSVPPPPGEFEPNAGCGTQPVDAKLAQVRPFTYADPGRFRPDIPDPQTARAHLLTSRAYARDFIETRDYGRANSTVRTPEQTDVVYFWSEHAFVHWNRNLISLAIRHGLSVRETARLMAMAHTAAADAVIAGFEAKYFWRSWRPRNAIPEAHRDGNPHTDPDPTWVPLLTVNHPEYPSAHGFWSAALTDAVAAFFRTSRVNWTIVTSTTAVPQVVRAERTYANVNAIMREIEDARVWAGLHWRHSTRHGTQLGHQVAQHVVGNFFRPLPD